MWRWYGVDDAAGWHVAFRVAAIREVWIAGGVARGGVAAGCRRSRRDHRVSWPRGGSWAEPPAILQPIRP